MASLLVSACGGPPPGAPAGACAEVEAGVACLELGIGAEAAPAVDGADVELVFGPQGGWHVDAGVRLRGIDAAGTAVTYEARREDDGLVLSTVRLGVNPRRLIEQSPYLVRTGDLVAFEIESDDAVLDRMITIEVRLEDASGAEIASDVRTLRVVDRVR